MKDKILYHLATARVYLSMAQSMHSEIYLKSCENQIELARLLIYGYNQDMTQEYILPLAAQEANMVNLELVHKYFNGTNISYEITGIDYGSNKKIIYVDRHIFDHLFFSRLGFGIIVTKGAA